MFFTKIWPCDIIEETNINDWKTFSYTYALNNGLNVSEAENFSDMISYFIGNGNIPSKDNKLYKIQKIEFDILKAYEEIKEQITDEQEQVQTLFEYTFILYKDKIYRYAKKSERLNFRVTMKQLVDFDSVPGENRTDKLQTLLEYYYKN